jgi:hypothetical protein
MMHARSLRNVSRVLPATLLLFLLLLPNVKARAAIPVRQAGAEKHDRYLDAGVFVGGHDQGPMNLLNVRHSIQGAEKMERLVFDMGQDSNDSISGRPGFFHISVQKNPRRVVIDFEDLSHSRVTAEQMSKLLEKSPHFSKVRFYADSKYRNLTIEMPLKEPAKIEVFELVGQGKPGRIVLDVKGP